MSASILAGGGVALASDVFHGHGHATTRTSDGADVDGGHDVAASRHQPRIRGRGRLERHAWPSTTLLIVGSVVAIGLPLGLAFALRGRDAWQNALAMLWIATLVALGQFSSDLPLFAWWAVGAIGLVAWGVAEARVERINLGAVAFAATVLTFYFSQVMDKLGRSASLIGLGPPVPRRRMGARTPAPAPGRRSARRDMSPRLRKGLIVAVASLALVASLGAKMLADRAMRPRVWARVVPFDPTCRSAAVTFGWPSRATRTKRPRASTTVTSSQRFE